MKVRVKKLLAVSLLCLALVSQARADLAKRIDSIITQPSQKKVQFSIHIVKADSGQTVYSHNANRAMVPASNVKIITTAAAIKYLGPDYKYKTQIGLCGDTLVVIGSGDPLLADKVTDLKYHRADNWIFEDIIVALKKNSQTTIRDIIVDTTIFDDQRVHPNWPADQLNRDYACEVSGLNFNGNCIDITAKNSNGKVTILIEPKTSFVEVLSKITPIKKGKGAIGAYRNQQPNKIIIKGKCKNKQGPFAVAIERPAAFFGHLLAENLISARINTNGQFVEKTIDSDCDIKKLTEYSTPITDCLARCNKNSFGLAAEALLKTIAAETAPDRKNGSWAAGREVISKYLLELGIDKKEFHIDDGSGLSRENKLSANALTKVLLDVYKSKNRRLYKQSLAAGGQDGTIAKYFKAPKYKGRISGKTGYLDGVKSFSGLCSTTDGDYIFSILANSANGQTRKAINDIAKAIIDEN